MFLKELTELNAVSGNENAVRNFIKEKAAPLCDKVEVDRLGSVICWKYAKEENAKTVMLSAHMDEVGFMVQWVKDDGIIRYMEIGDVNPKVCVSKRVCIGDKKVPAVIGCKAVHLQERDERTRALKHEQLYMDIGAKDKADASKKVKIGDYIAFESEYMEFGKDKIKAKALDSRIGCDALLELMQDTYPCKVAFVFNVQTELGLRGAKGTAFAVQPDVALVLETAEANDVAGAEAHEEVTALGKGVGVAFMDKTAIANPQLFTRMTALAEEKNIPWQFVKGAVHETDTGAIQRARGGCAAVTLSVPVRYRHSPVCVCDKNDIASEVALVKAFLNDGGKF